MSTRNILISAIFASFILIANCQAQPTVREHFPPARPIPSDVKIQVALLLDCSNSMDGLIDQAKSRLWSIVNTLTTLKYQGKEPVIEISLYQYGNDDLSAESNWVKQVTPFTTDLDYISEKLFALRTNGGQEYCGAVMQHAIRNLKWNSNGSSMKLMYIAGNEPFDQGGIHYKEVVSHAKKHQVHVNTIFCGNYSEGIRTFWQDGAIAGNGKYFNINSDEKIIHIKTPYDAKIREENEKLNKTYLGYGKLGRSKKMTQRKQDMNAESMSSSIAVERAVTKSKSNVYKNANWDIVDKVAEDESFIQEAKEEELPEELRGKSKTEKMKIVKEQSAKRSKIQREIETLAKKRQIYIAKEKKKLVGKDNNDLGNAIKASIVEIGKNKGFRSL